MGGGQAEILLSFSIDRDEKLMSIVLQRQKDEDPLRYRFGMKTPLKGLLLDYCMRKGIGFDHLRFIYDGRRINGKETPLDLEMENGDAIDVFSDQIGGATCLNL